MEVFQFFSVWSPSAFFSILQLLVLFFQYYLRVLSRPMGMAHREGGLSRTPKWTPVYTDYTTEVTQNLREVHILSIPNYMWEINVGIKLPEALLESFKMNYLQ